MVRFSLAFEGDRPLEEYVRYLGLAERYGFYSLQVYEHLTFRPAWAIAFRLAPLVRRLRLGPVTVPALLHHPLYIAASAAALDEATGGRAILGISRGAFYEAIGLPVARPLTAVREAVEAVDRLLRGEAGYQGKVFTVAADARLHLARRPDVELYVGSSGPRTIAMASGLRPVRAIVVDNLWNPAYAAKVRGFIARGAARVGRDPAEVGLIARPFASVAADGRAARAYAAGALARYLPALAAGSPMLTEAGVGPQALRAFAADPLGGGLADRIVGSFAAAGTPEEIAEQTERMVRAGVDHVCFGHPLGPDPGEAIVLLGERVLPRFPDPEGTTPGGQL